MSKHVREKCGKTVFQACNRKVRKNCISSILSFQKGHNSNKNWRKLTKLELGLYLSKTKSCEKFQLNISKHVRENCGKLCIFSILCSKRGITPTKIDAKWRHLNFVCISVKKKSCAKFQLNMSKHVREKCGKLCIYSIPSSKRGITPTKIDTKWRHSNLICSILNKVIWKLSAQYVKACKRKSAENCVFSVL